jgi:hypothetical protein
MADRGRAARVSVLFLTVVALGLSACASGDEANIRDSIEEEAGPAVSVDHCDEIGEHDGRQVFECFGESYAKGSELGCYSVGNADNVIEESCAHVKALPD